MRCDRIVALAGVLLALGQCSVEPRDPGADALQREGSELLDQKRFDEARRALLEALERHRRVEDRANAFADASLISRSYWSENAFPEALRWIGQARDEAIAAGSETLQTKALLEIGHILSIVGDEALAAQVYAEAEPRLPDSERAEHVRIMIYRALHLQKKRGGRAQADQMLEEARDLARAAGIPRQEMAASINLTDLALAENRLDDAERFLADARAAWRAAGSKPISRLVISMNEALLALGRGRFEAAWKALDDAAVGAPIDSEWRIVRYRGLVAEAAGRLDEAEALYREAVAIVEKMRVESAPLHAKAPFFEERWDPYENLFSLQVARRDPRGALSTLLLAQGRMFADALAVSLSEERDPGGSPIDSAIGRIHVLERVVPALARSPLHERVEPDDILAELRGKHVLAYFPDNERLRLIAIVDGEPRITSVDVGLQRLEELVEDFRARPEDGRVAATLGEALLPGDALPAGPGRIYVVPTGPLLRVPFLALSLSGQRLLDRHEIAYAPSVTWLAAIARRGERAAGQPVVLADMRDDLAEARSELDAVVAATGAIPYDGKRAKDALQAAAGARLFHVISHSGLNAQGGYLLFSDQEVTAAYILDEQIRPRLAVLPTCASAATVRREMWGSLAAAFLAAGSEHVVATLVSVDDRVAADFTRLFYDHGGAEDPVGAATRAQRTMSGTRSVAEWSAFVVVGP